MLAVLTSGALPGLPEAWGQEEDSGGGDGGSEGARIEITSGEPCFLDEDAPHRVLQNCGAKDDWLAFALGPWEYVTGGLFSMVIVAILVLAVWAKYRQAIYPIFIGIVMLPLSWFLFPSHFLGFAVLLAAIGVGALIWWAVMRQTE